MQFFMSKYILYDCFTTSTFKYYPYLFSTDFFFWGTPRCGWPSLRCYLEKLWRPGFSVRSSAREREILHFITPAIFIFMLYWFYGNFCNCCKLSKTLSQAAYKFNMLLLITESARYLNWFCHSYTLIMSFQGLRIDNVVWC